MRPDVKKYLFDFENAGLKNNHGIILLEQNRVSYKSKYCGLHKYLMDHRKIFVKAEHPGNLINGMASSRMYNDLGIITPITFPVQTNYDIKANTFRTASQDVNSLNNFSTEFSIADNIEDMQDFKNLFALEKKTTMWEIFKNPKALEMIYEIMTPECFEELISIFILDELRSDGDRHFGNYFLYKNCDSKKYEGVIPIDLEHSFLPFDCEEEIDSSFKRFLVTPCSHFNVYQQVDKHRNHYQRILQIIELLNQGKLTTTQIKTLKDTVKYDLPKTIKGIYDKYNIQEPYNVSYELFSRLWDFNYNVLSDELGI